MLPRIDLILQEKGVLQFQDTVRFLSQLLTLQSVDSVYHYSIRLSKVVLHFTCTLSLPILFARLIRIGFSIEKKEEVNHHIFDLLPLGASINTM